jgi:hypothetical protein
MLFFIPTILLHYRYYLITNGARLCIDANYSNYTFSKNGEYIDFNNGEVDSAILYCSYAFARNSVSRLFWDDYHHVDIHLKNGKRLIITSLLTGKDIRQIFPDQSFFVHKGIYRWI